MHVLVLALLSIAVAAPAQQTRFDAPWLTVYDVAGRPRWEVELETLSRSAEGWQGQEARIVLYHEGERQAEVHAAELTTDPLGREWVLQEGVRGSWETLLIEARRGRWQGSLTLWEVEAQAEEMFVSAAEARWSPGSPVELLDVHVVIQGWELRFARGEYLLDHETLVAVDVELRGHGLTVAAAKLQVAARGGEVTLSDAQLSPSD